MRKFSHKDRSKLVLGHFKLPIDIMGRIRAIRISKGITQEALATAAFLHYLPIIEGATAPAIPLEGTPAPLAERSIKLVKAKRTRARLYKADHAETTAKERAILAKAKAEHARAVRAVKKASKASGESLFLKLLD